MFRVSNLKHISNEKYVNKEVESSRIYIRHWKFKLTINSLSKLYKNTHYYL